MTNLDKKEQVLELLQYIEMEFLSSQDLKTLEIYNFSKIFPSFKRKESDISLKQEVIIIEDEKEPKRKSKKPKKESLETSAKVSKKIDKIIKKRKKKNTKKDEKDDS